jgi:hypothetical protein
MSGSVSSSKTLHASSALPRLDLALVLAHLLALGICLGGVRWAPNPQGFWPGVAANAVFALARGAAAADQLRKRG